MDTSRTAGERREGGRGGNDHANRGRVPRGAPAAASGAARARRRRCQRRPADGVPARAHGGDPYRLGRARDRSRPTAAPPSGAQRPRAARRGRPRLGAPGRHLRGRVPPAGRAPGAPRRRRRVLSVWEQLAEAGPAWERWAATFAAGAPVRAAIEAGRLPELDERVAAVALASARDFHDEVRATVREAETVAVPSLAS